MTNRQTDIQTDKQTNTHSYLRYVVKIENKKEYDKFSVSHEKNIILLFVTSIIYDLKNLQLFWQRFSTVNN